MTHGLEKLETAKTFLETAMLLERCPYPVEIGGSREEIQERVDELTWHKVKVCHFLYAIIFELAIKIIWEVENGEECEHHHHLLEFYTGLSCEKQSRIKELYDTQSSLIRTQEGRQRTGNLVRVNDLTEYQSLEEALEANATIVRDFKYDGRYRGKSSVICGVIWNNETGILWMLPEKFIIFPKELLKYAREIVESQGAIRLNRFWAPL